MNMLSKLTTDAAIDTEKDSIGGGGTVESGVYKLKINTAYLKTSDGGALALVVDATTSDGREIRQTLWMTSGTAKGGNNYYVDKSGNKQYLPGFNMANSLALLTCGKEISQLDTEKKVVNIWSSELKTDVPTTVDMLMDLVNKEVIAGIIKQTVDKTTKDNAGNYVPTGETRDENEIDKLFRASDSLTTAEIRGQVTEPTFINTWSTKWSGKTRVKVSKTPPGTGAKPTPGATQKPTTSLFG